MASKASKNSAGLLVYRIVEPAKLDVFLVHPGGPFWAKKDLGSWSIPKGEFTAEEDAFEAACREFTEETGFDAPKSSPLRLGTFKQPSGKVIHAWAVSGELDAAQLRSNTFSIEWPPKSGKQQEFPEVDRAAWFPIGEAMRRITSGQQQALEGLAQQLRTSGVPIPSMESMAQTGPAGDTEDPQQSLFD